MKFRAIVFILLITPCFSFAQDDLDKIITKKKWVVCGTELDWEKSKEIEIYKEGEECEQMANDPTEITLRFNENKQLAYSKFTVDELTTNEESGIVGLWKLNAKKKLLKITIADGKKKVEFNIAEADKKRMLLKRVDK